LEKETFGYFSSIQFVKFNLSEIVRAAKVQVNFMQNSEHHEKLTYIRNRSVRHIFEEGDFWTFFIDPVCQVS
jgi:hypothetical protein